MHTYSVLLVVARGACLDVGRRIRMTVLAPSRLDAAIQAESLADASLSETEYTPATRVRMIPRHQAAALALAA